MVRDYQDPHSSRCHCPSLRQGTIPHRLLETGPPLQNRGNRFHPVALARDLKQAFLQVRIQEGDRDAMRFHRLEDLIMIKINTKFL